ncbi:hypothetical protein DU506_01345 [Vreelandella rituensis]|uniref:Uncharacterized protein n=2 Tax=Vreelandella rituensis TaxID=2282306 RepID=A0A368U9P7_9GAMM|nr:hypothetical protein DU506_01345 [Halomonas rituensis]
MKPVQDYFEQKYAVKLSPTQASRYRLVLADMEEGYRYLCDRLGESSTNADKVWFEAVTPGSPGAKEMFKGETPSKAQLNSLVSAAHKEFQQMARSYVEKGYYAKGYQGVVQWLDRWVGPGKGIVRMRGALNHLAREALLKAGVTEGAPERETKTETGTALLLTYSRDLFDVLQRRLSGAQRLVFARRVSSGSKAYQAIGLKKGLDPEQEAERDLIDFEVWRNMLKSVEALDIKLQKADKDKQDAVLQEGLQKFLDDWMSDGGYQFLRRALIQYRHERRNVRSQLSVPAYLKDFVMQIKSEHGLGSQGDALAFILEDYADLMGYDIPEPE